MRREDRDKILHTLHRRLYADVSRRSDAGGPSIEEVLADGVYHEQRRLKDDHGAPAYAKDRAFWKDIRTGLGRSSETELQRMLGRVISHYADEICGNFDERIYQVATKVLPPALGLLLNSFSPKRMLKNLPGGLRLDDQVVLHGDIGHLHALHERGTLVFAPTHVSNLDSIILGFAIYKMGLPPAVYGAGLNLFSNPMMGFFMGNLGAYTVDRKKRDPLYKEVLKAYATLTMEHGYDNLFFPGGTRSRAGAIETKLKLGLMGTTIDAYINNLRAQKENPKMFVVPLTLSFELVLEAETLIDDFLRDVGKSRYIITDDEFSSPGRILDFVRQLMALNSKLHVRVCPPMDPFGNPVDEKGQSLDPLGRVIACEQHVFEDGRPVKDAARDREYTEELGNKISDAFMRNNQIQSTHLVAHAVFGLLRTLNRSTDVVRLLRVGAFHEEVGLLELYREVDRIKSELKGLEARGGICLDQSIQNAAADDIVASALRAFACFHSQRALTRRGDRIIATDRSLLFYYHNRLEGYRFGRALQLGPVLSQDHRSLSSGATGGRQ